MSLDNKKRTILIEIHVAVDSRGQWFAYGSGLTDDSDFRDESLALFNATAAWLNHEDEIGCDEADIERFTVLAEIPIPDHVLFANKVKAMPKQRELFAEEAKECLRS